MNLTWLSPGWLWLAGAVTLPLVIHLLSRNAGRPLRFAALRFVPRAPLNKLLGIALSQRMLLLLRCLMVLALTLLLAQPRLESGASLTGAVAVLVSPLALARYPELARATADIEAARAGVSPRILGQGFPGLDQSLAPGRPAEAIARTLEKELVRFEQVTVVIAPGGADRLWRRPPLAAPIRWLELEPPVSAASAIAVVAAPDRREDERTLRAAIEAAVSVANVRPWRLLPVDSREPADVLFTLGDVAADNPRALRIRDTLEPLDSVMRVAVGDQVLQQHYASSAAITGAEPDRLVLLASEGNLQGKPAEGGEMLATLADGEILFHSRFTAQAGELVSSGRLPLLVNEWLMLAGPSAPRWQPASIPMAWWPAWLLLGIWVLERILSRGAYDARQGNIQ